MVLQHHIARSVPRDDRRAGRHGGAAQKLPTVVAIPFDTSRQAPAKQSPRRKLEIASAEKAPPRNDSERLWLPRVPPAVWASRNDITGRVCRAAGNRHPDRPTLVVSGSQSLYIVYVKSM